MALNRKFTDSWIKSVSPPASGRDVYSDSDTPGLSLRVTSNGKKTFGYAFRFDAKTRRMTFGQYPGLSLKEARGHLLNARSQLVGGEDPSLGKQERKRARDLTVETPASEFIEPYAKQKNKSWRQAEDNLRLHILPSIGSS